jgi:HK97 family phage prohead protease
MNKLISVPFVKIDDDQHMIYGYASTSHRDSDGEIITLDALRAALPGYMKFATVREMHAAKPVGKTKEASVDENGLYIGAKISDNNAWKLIKDEVYSAFSIGGKIVERDDSDPTIIKGMSLMEISLVDVPANINCTIDLFKVADMSDDTKSDKKKKKKSEDDTDSDGDDDTTDTDDNDDDASKSLDSRDAAEEEVLYKRMVDRFGQAKADEIFAKHDDPVTHTDDDHTSDKTNIADSHKELVSEPVTERPIEAPVEKMASEIEFLASALIADLYKDFDIDTITSLQATAKKEEVRKLLEMVKATKDICAKAGARNSRADIDKLQTIHDHSNLLGATCTGSHKGVQAGDLSKAYEKSNKLTKQLNDANDVINKLNKQISDREDFIEKLKKTAKVPMPITTSAELPDGLFAIEKGSVKKVSDINKSDPEEEIKKGWRQARQSAISATN